MENPGKNHKKRSGLPTAPSGGFTLFELSLVLVIIALIIGAVLGGEAMMRNAELQSVIEDTNTYLQAVKLFRDKYHELPGDMENAESFWGSDTSCPNTPANATPKIATCNGNGDGFIGDSTGSPHGTTIKWYETFRTWQQLTDAGFIKGSYNGALSSRTIGNAPDPGMNIPTSKITGNGFSIMYAEPVPGGTGVFHGNYHHVIVYGAPGSTYLNSTYAPGLATTDALTIDQKIDDGMPGTGTVMTFATSILPNCATSNDPATARYNTAYSGNACSLIFITGF